MTTTKKPRGFAAMSTEKRKAIASAGGEAAHANGKAHRFTAAEARAAGAKGGRAVGKNRRAFTSEEAREAGRRGGLASQARRRHLEEAEAERQAAYREHQAP